VRNGSLIAAKSTFREIPIFDALHLSIPFLMRQPAISSLVCWKETSTSTFEDIKYEEIMPRIKAAEKPEPTPTTVTPALELAKQNTSR